MAEDQYPWPARFAGATHTVRSMLERQIREGELLWSPRARRWCREVLSGLPA